MLYLLILHTDGRQAVNQNCFMGFFFGHCRPILFPFPGLGMNTQSQGFPFSQLVEVIHTDFQGLPTSLTIIVFFMLCGMPDGLIEPGSGLLGQ